MARWRGLAAVVVLGVALSACAAEQVFELGELPKDPDPQGAYPNINLIPGRPVQLEAPPLNAAQQEAVTEELSELGARRPDEVRRRLENRQ